MVHFVEGLPFVALQPTLEGLAWPPGPRAAPASSSSAPFMPPLFPPALRFHCQRAMSCDVVGLLTSSHELIPWVHRGDCGGKSRGIFVGIRGGGRSFDWKALGVFSRAGSLRAVVRGPSRWNAGGLGRKRGVPGAQKQGGRGKQMRGNRCGWKSGAVVNHKLLTGQVMLGRHTWDLSLP